MSIEQALATLTAAVEANTAAIKAAGGKPAATASASASTGAADKPKAEPKTTAKSEHSRDEMIAALNKVKEATDAATAKGIIKSAGGVDKMADIPDSKIDAVYKAATEKLAGDGESGDGL